MAEIHHFEHGWVTPTFSYLLSFLGSLLGLICAVRLRSAPSTGWRAWWLGLAAVAIGGTGIWTMHFVAMMGFGVVGSPIRYDVATTAISAVIAVIAVGIGLSIVSLGAKARRTRIVLGGMLTGLGVAAMHYTGMFAMRLDGDIDYAGPRVGASIAIAVVAATVALWLAITVRGTAAIAVSALIMGVAVNGMHFTGMSAMSVRSEPPSGDLSGAGASTLLIPIGVAVLFGVLGLAYALMAAPTDEDRAALAYLESRRNGGAATPPGPASPPAGAATASRPASPAAGAVAVPSPTAGGLTDRRSPGSSWSLRIDREAAPAQSEEPAGRPSPTASWPSRSGGEHQSPSAEGSAVWQSPAASWPSAGSGQPASAPATFGEAAPWPPADSAGSWPATGTPSSAPPADPPSDASPEPGAIPTQRRPGRRMPSLNSSWTYRDRTRG